MRVFPARTAALMHGTAQAPTQAGGAHRVDVWLAYYQAMTAPALRERMDAVLNDAERRQAARFYFADDRLRYLVTRALVRTVLARYAPIAPAAWEFEANGYGRPAPAAHHGVPGLSFNLSHTHGLIALAVSGTNAVGIDVEHRTIRAAPLDIAPRFFAPAEVAALAALPPEARTTRFFEYWTLKEAYIKARGMGLSLPLDRFCFAFPDAHTVRLAFDDSLADTPQRWCFWQYAPTPDYLLALCVERAAGVVPTVAVRTVVPFGHDAPVAVRWDRTGV